MPNDMTIPELHSITSDYGDVMSIDLWDEKDSKTAVIEYVCEKDAVKALNELDNRRMMDWNKRLMCSIVR